MFLGWFDPDRKRPAIDKLNEAIDRYTEKFGIAPEICLTSFLDADDVREGATLPVRPVTFLKRGVFYVGVEDRG